MLPCLASNRLLSMPVSVTPISNCIRVPTPWHPSLCPQPCSTMLLKFPKLYLCFLILNGSHHELVTHKTWDIFSWVTSEMMSYQRWCHVLSMCRGQAHGYISHSGSRTLSKDHLFPQNQMAEPLHDVTKWVGDCQSSIVTKPLLLKLSVGQHSRKLSADEKSTSWPFNHLLRFKDLAFRMHRMR